MATFVLTDIEVACGITVEAVREARLDSLVRWTSDGARVVVDGRHGPALAFAAARMALGVPAKYLGRTQLGQGVYGPLDDAI